MITKIIRSLNPNKSSGWDNVSSHMIMICDNSISRPLKLIFENCINTGIYPNKWKMSNVCPIYKKDSRNLTKN